MPKAVYLDDLNAWATANAFDVEDDGTAPIPPEPSGDPKPVGITGNFNLVFRDEFDGTKLNDAYWTANWLGAPGTITKPINSKEIAAYDPKNVKVANGSLELYAERRAVTDAQGKRYDYASGCITSGEKKEFKFGIFEARLLLPVNSSGIPLNWPAWWQNGHHDEWPDAGETDTMERLSEGVCAHYHANTGKDGADINKKSPPWTANFSQWHVYSVEWARNLLVVRYDGAEQMRMTSGVLEDEQYLVLNHALSNEIGGPLVVPSTFKVDYVRVWTRS